MCLTWPRHNEKYQLTYRETCYWWIETCCIQSGFFIAIFIWNLLNYQILLKLSPIMISRKGLDVKDIESFLVIVSVTCQSQSPSTPRFYIKFTGARSTHEGLILQDKIQTYFRVFPPFHQQLALCCKLMQSFNTCKVSIQYIYA